MREGGAQEDLFDFRWNQPGWGAQPRAQSSAHNEEMSVTEQPETCITKLNYAQSKGLVIALKIWEPLRPPE